MQVSITYRASTPEGPGAPPRSIEATAQIPEAESTCLDSKIAELVQAVDQALGLQPPARSPVATHVEPHRHRTQIPVTSQ